jgi:two-component system cell cycle response regulator
MTTLVTAVLTLRRTARASYGYAVAGVMGAATVLGLFRRDPSELDVPHALMAAAWIAAFGARAAQRFRDEERLRDEELARASARTELELGVLLLALVHAVVQVGGGLSGDLYPLVYVLVAFVASFSERAVASALMLVAMAFEAAIFFVAEKQTDVKAFAYHVVFVVFFGILNLLFTRAEIARVRERSKRERNEERRRVEEESRMFRLVAAPTAGATKDDERLLRSSIAEVHNALFHQLDVLQRSMGLESCVVLMLDETGERLRVAEAVTGSEDFVSGPFAASAGAISAVVTRGVSVKLDSIKAGFRGICYYEGAAPVRSFIALPISEGPTTRGVLCADRRDERAFTAKEEELLRLTAKQVLRITENERVFVQLEQSKHEQQTLYRASQALGAALTEDQVLDAGMAAVRDVTGFDFAAITVFDAKKKQHAVRRAEGDGAAAFDGFTFSDNSSLTAMAVKNAHYLPYRGDFDPRQQVVFTKRSNLTGMQSLLIVPLVVREAAIGTIVIGARKASAFGASVRPTMQVLANHLGVSLSNAGAVRRLEEMATTDGLTGCLNKRAFLEQLESKMKSAERFGRSLCLIVTDIDHFKRVNDTYGHATGDVVIKELGELLRRVKRETDIVARFGGEEFCVLCEETQAEGGVLLAERIRDELSKVAFQTEQGVMHVTCSLGVATFPTDAASGASLFESADKALYAAKHAGRNRVEVA